jgi:hypothetical protein
MQAGAPTRRTYFETLHSSSLAVTVSLGSRLASGKRSVGEEGRSVGRARGGSWVDETEQLPREKSSLGVSSHRYSRAGGQTSFSSRPKLPQGLTELLEGRAWAWVERRSRHGPCSSNTAELAALDNSSLRSLCARQLAILIFLSGTSAVLHSHCPTGSREPARSFAVQKRCDCRCICRHPAPQAHILPDMLGRAGPTRCFSNPQELPHQC